MRLKVHFGYILFMSSAAIRSSNRRFGLAGERRRRHWPSAVEEETTGGLIQGLAVVEAALLQRAHSTRVVAGVDILRRASAHKRSPLFRRRAPAPNTARPEGSPRGSRYQSGQGAREPLG